MKVEIWSDIVCPWCYIGKRRFEKALESFPGEVEVEFRSFQLDPTSPAKPQGPLDEAIAKKFGMGIERARQMFAQISEAAAAEGLDFDLDNARGGNTFDTHRVLHYARSVGLQAALKERLMKAYFVDGVEFSDPEELIKLAAEVGLDAADVRDVIQGDAYKEEVRADLQRARQVGVRGVPFYLINGEVGVSGAQPPQSFLNALNHAQSAAKEAGADCADGFCEIPDH